MLDLKIIPNFKHHIFLFFSKKWRGQFLYLFLRMAIKKCPLKMERDKIPVPFPRFCCYMYVPATSWAVDKVCFNFAER